MFSIKQTQDPEMMTKKVAARLLMPGVRHLVDDETMTKELLEENNLMVIPTLLRAKTNRCASCAETSQGSGFS